MLHMHHHETIQNIEELLRFTRSIRLAFSKQEGKKIGIRNFRSIYVFLYNQSKEKLHKSRKSENMDGTLPHFILRNYNLGGRLKKDPRIL
jgi:hypothetical protein